MATAYDLLYDRYKDLSPHDYHAGDTVVCFVATNEVFTHFSVSFDEYGVIQTMIYKDGEPISVKDVGYSNGLIRHASLEEVDRELDRLSTWGQNTDEDDEEYIMFGDIRVPLVDE